MTKEQIYLDLSKCSEEQIKALPKMFENSGDKVLTETLIDLISGKITDGFKFLFYSPSGWNQDDYPLNGHTEITYPEFIKLFEGRDGEKKSRVEMMTDQELQEALRVETAELEALRDSVGSIETEIFYRRNPDHRR